MRQGNETKGRGLLERRFEQLLGFFLQLLFDGEVRIQKLVAGFGQVAAVSAAMCLSGVMIESGRSVMSCT